VSASNRNKATGLDSSDKLTRLTGMELTEAFKILDMQENNLQKEAVVKVSSF
jgi:hypothetical protein